MIMTSTTPIQAPCSGGSYPAPAASGGSCTASISTKLEKPKNEISKPRNPISVGANQVAGSSSWGKPLEAESSEPIKNDPSIIENPANSIRSDAWVGPLKREISKPIKVDQSIFDDAEEEEEFRLPSEDVAALRLSSGGTNTTVGTNTSGLELLSSASVYSLGTISFETGTFNPLGAFPPETKGEERVSTVEFLRKAGILDSSRNRCDALIKKRFGDAQNEKHVFVPPQRQLTSSSPCQSEVPPNRVAQEAIVSDADQVPNDAIQEWDILSGRGGKSNHHSGNKRFRQVVDEMKSKYRTTNVKTDKTALSKAIVDYVEGYGGRFLTRKGAKQGHFRIMAKAESRKKTSQALRETKELKWKLNSSSPIS